MPSQSAGFARYSKTLCWMVSFIWLALSVAAFTGESGNSLLMGFLWLAGAIAFAISAIYLSRDVKPENTSAGDEQHGE